MTDPIRIGPRLVGAGAPCYVIAEAGSNHDRDMEVARRMIDVAADAGADAVKFQSFTASRIAADTKHPIATLRDRFGAYGGTLRTFYANAELPAGWIRELFAYARERGVTPLSTPFDEHAVDELVELGIEVLKIASFELVHLPLLRHCAGTGLPIILSTGMATLGEIEEALETIHAAGGGPVALLHCNIEYPPRMEDVELRAMETMRVAFRRPVGFSDHTDGYDIPIAAVALGADVIEKHFTLDRSGRGPDHGFAIEPDELTAMIWALRRVESALGRGRKGPVEAEAKHRERGRRSLFAREAIPAGTRIEAEMLDVLRPGIGLHPRYAEHLVGRRLARDLEAQEPITWDAVLGIDADQEG